MDLMSAEGFAAVPTWMFRETQRVSLYAIMVYGSLATRAGLRSNIPSRETIAREARCSVRKVADALNELEALGVLERVRRTGASGQASNGYVLLSGRGVDERSTVEAPDALTDEVEAGDARGGGTSEQVAPLIEVDRSQVDRTPVVPLLDVAFDEFWSLFPAGRKKAKSAARRAFAGAVKRAGLDAVMAGVRRYAADTNLPAPEFIPMPSTWLNQGRWEDEPEPARGGGSSSAWEAAKSVALQLAEHESAQREFLGTLQQASLEAGAR